MGTEAEVLGFIIGVSIVAPAVIVVGLGLVAVWRRNNGKN